MSKFIAFSSLALLAQTVALSAFAGTPVVCVDPEGTREHGLSIRIIEVKENYRQGTDLHHIAVISRTSLEGSKVLKRVVVEPSEQNTTWQGEGFELKIATMYPVNAEGDFRSLWRTKPEARPTELHCRLGGAWR